MSTTVVDEVGSTQVITSEMDEAAFLRSQIVEIRRRKDGLCAERAEHANTEVQIRPLPELVGEVVRNGLPERMAREEQPEGEETGARCGYDDSFSRTRHAVPEGVLDEDGRMGAFDDDPAIRHPDRVVVGDGGCEVAFKAGVTVGGRGLRGARGSISLRRWRRGCPVSMRVTTRGKPLLRSCPRLCQTTVRRGDASRLSFAH